MRQVITRAAVLAALALGLAVGIVGALAVGRDDGADPGSASAAARPALRAADDPGSPRPASGGDPRRPRVAPAVRVPRDALALRAAGPVRVELRVRDPRGGPDWAIRTFVAERVTPARMRRPGVDPVIGRSRCAQLGRVLDGRFGWIDAANTFRPAGIGSVGTPLWCGSRRVRLGGRSPHVEVLHRISDPAAGAAVPTQTVVWGLGGPGARPRLALAGRAVALPRTPSGVVLAVTGPDLRPPQVRVDGRTPGGAAGRTARATVEARAPDPHGGIPYGLAAARDDDGSPCVSGPGRVVGDRVGSVHFGLGTFQDTSLGAHRCGANAGPLSPARPFTFGVQGGDMTLEPAADPLVGRVARRTLRGITIVYGRTLPDVTQITVATPRDVRTVLPSRRFHVFLVAYDGTFPTGELVVTATLRDGTTYEQRQEAGF